MKTIILSTLIISIGISVYNAKERYKLYKDFNNKEITILNPKEFKTKFTKKDSKKLKSLTLGEDILKFKNRIEECVNNDHLNNMYNNFKSIKTKENLLLFMILNLGGSYNPSKNLIKINPVYKNESINHELLHCSSAYYDKLKKYAYVGFHQIDYKNNKEIGRALNEGYTSLLANRYFPKIYIEESDAYQISQLFAMQIEKIVGQRKMEKAYFNANLNMLIKELEQYDTRENIISVIKSLDFILKYLKEKQDLILGSKIKEYLRISLKNIQYHLIRWYGKKLKNDLDNKLITKGEFKRELKNYLSVTRKSEILEKIPKKKIKIN